MKKIPAVVDPTLAASILGVSIRTAQKKLCKMKKVYKKSGPQQYISLSEFSRYTGIPMQDILRTLGVENSQ